MNYELCSVYEIPLSSLFWTSSYLIFILFSKKQQFTRQVGISLLFRSEHSSFWLCSKRSNRTRLRVGRVSGLCCVGEEGRGSACCLFRPSLKVLVSVAAVFCVFVCFIYLGPCFTRYWIFFLEVMLCQGYSLSILLFSKLSFFYDCSFFHSVGNNFYKWLIYSCF